MLIVVVGCRKDPADVFETVSSSVVVIWASDTSGDALGQGSGVVLQDSQVVTNCHVVDDASRIEVSQKNDTIDAHLIAQDEERDLCLLQLTKSLGKSARIGTSADLRIGLRVYTVGAPVGMELTIGEGLLSGFRVFDSSRYLQTTAPISPGSSGGGLWDERGRLLGITSFYEEFAQSVNFAAPVEWVAQIRERSRKRLDTAQTTVWLERFSVLARNRDWMGLKAHSGAWCRREPGNAWAWYARGVAARNLHEPMDTTMRVFRKALQLNERFGEAWEQLALTWGDIDSLPQELQYHLRAVECLPHSSVVWFNLAVCAANLGNHDLAVHGYRRSLKEGGDDARTLARLGLSLMRQGKISAASAVLAQGLALDSTNVEIHRIRAMIHQKRGMMDSAMAGWRRVIDRQPEDWMAWHNLGVWQFRQRKWQQAVLSFEEAVRLEPGDDDAWYGIAASQQARGRTAQGMLVLRKALLKRDSSAFLWRTLGELALQGDFAQDAWDACHRAVVLAPGDGNSWACRSQASFRLGRPAQAMADGRRAVRLLPSRIDLQRTIALSSRILDGKAVEPAVVSLR